MQKFDKWKEAEEGEGEKGCLGWILYNCMCVYDRDIEDVKQKMFVFTHVLLYKFKRILVL